MNEEKTNNERLPEPKNPDEWLEDFIKRLEDGDEKALKFANFILKIVPKKI